jgi:hypothetical protein
LSSRLTDTGHGYDGEMISYYGHVRIGGFVGESRPLHPPISEAKSMSLAEQHEKMLLKRLVWITGREFERKVSTL